MSEKSYGERGYRAKCVGIFTYTRNILVLNFGG